MSPEICYRGHKFYKWELNGKCPGCADDRKRKAEFLDKLPAATKAAFLDAGLRTPRMLSLKTTEQVSSICGVDSKIIQKLKRMLRTFDLEFRE